MKNFAITGVAGYIAPRHLKAIKATGNNLLAATDPHDSVGILDGYFFNVAYFKEFERFDRFLEKQRKKGNEEDSVHYVSICSPNYLHDAHIRFSLRVGAHAICEKPLVLNPWNADALLELEEEFDKRVFTVLQLRHHPSIMALKKEVQSTEFKKGKHQVKLHYITSRGPWYHYSWKGDVERSGGLATNIGVHFFDMLIWIFGAVEGIEVSQKTNTLVEGQLELEHASVSWLLSVDKDNLPAGLFEAGQTTYRSITVDGREVEFSGGFTDLHTEVYRNILEGRGFGIRDAMPSIDLVHKIRKAKV